MLEAGNSFATASRRIVGNTLLVTGVDLRKERGMSVSTAAAVAGRRSAWAAVVPVSYTHLTLPTILLV